MITRLLGRLSSINVRKVLWTLDEVGVPYVFDEWEAVPSIPRLAQLARLNPNSMFPILVDDNGPLWESNSICRYVAAKGGRGDLLPEEPRARAEVEHWMDWQATDFNAAWVYAFLAIHRKRPDYADASATANSVHSWNEKVLLLDRHLGASDGYAAGSDFTLADIVIGLSVHRWLHVAIDRPRTPNVAAYYARLAARPNFRKYANGDVI